MVMLFKKSIESAKIDGCPHYPEKKKDRIGFGITQNNYIFFVCGGFIKLIYAIPLWFSTILIAGAPEKVCI